MPRFSKNWLSWLGLALIVLAAGGVCPLSVASEETESFEATCAAEPASGRTRVVRSLSARACVLPAIASMARYGRFPFGQRARVNHVAAGHRLANGLIAPLLI